MAGSVMAGPALARAIRSDFIDTWKRRYEASRAKLGKCMEFGVSSDNLVELYGYGETPIYPRRTEWGVAPERKPHIYRNYEVENYRWTAEVDWLRVHRELSNLKDIERRARGAGDNFGTLEERLFYQVLTAGADRQLLEAIPLAPDGAALHAALAEGADRFGVSGGNVVSGQTITTGAGFRSAIVNVQNRFLDFQDTEGEPAMDESVLERGLTVIYPNVRREQAMEAFIQALTSQEVSTSNAGVSNFVLDAGMKITLVPTQRLTVATTAFVFIDDFDIKPIFSQIAKPLWEMYYDQSNSVEHGRTGHESVVYEEWLGIGVNLPLGTCSITA